MDESDALDFLGQQTASTPSSLSGIPSSGSFGNAPSAPITSASIPPSGVDTALESSSPLGAFNKINQDRQQQYIQENTQDNVPFDPNQGLSAWERFNLSFRREHENQVSYLQKKYGENNVRLSSDGELIVRALDPKTQKPKDILVDEKGMSARDLIDIMGSVPEIAASIIAIRGGKGIPRVGNVGGIGGVARDVLAGAAGAETAGAVKDIGAGLYDTGTADVPKILSDRAKMAGADVAMGAATYPIGRFFQMMKSPFHSSRGPVQFDALDAQKYFKDKYGVDVPLSIGESTGSPLIGRTEAFIEKLPGGSTPFQQLKGQQEEALRKLQSIMMGKTPLTDEEVGKQLIDTLSQKVGMVESGVNKAAGNVSQTAQDQIADIVSGLSTPQRQLLRTETGQAIREGVTSKRDAAVAEANRLYGQVAATPGGTGKIFDGTDLQQRLQKIVGELPSPQTTQSVPTGILGPNGVPMVRTTTGKEVLNDWVSPAIVGKIKQVTDLKNPMFSLTDLQQMRRQVYDDMAASEAVTGLPNRRLNEIGKAITGAIDDGVNALPTGDLKTALQAANDHYKNNVVPFNRLGVTDLFKRADEPGFVANDEIVSRVFSGGKSANNYQLLKETLGDTSPEFLKLKRSIADHLIESSRYPGDELINANALKGALANFQNEHREISNDVFGSKLPDIFKQLSFLDVGKNKGMQISADDLATLLKDPSPTAAKLRGMMAAQKKQNEFYSNELLKSASSGKPGGVNINPIEFVNRFASSADTTPTDVVKVMGMIKSNPTLVDDVRAKTVEKIFRDASRVANVEDLSRLLSGDPTRIVSSTSVFKQIESPAVRQKIESILGPDIYKDLVQYVHLQKAGEMHETAFQAAGGLAAGMEIANLTKKGPLRYMYQAGKDWLVASLLTRQPLRGWLSNVPSSDQPGYVSLLLSSPPFIRAVTKEFGEGSGANAFMHSMKQSIDKYGQEQANQPQNRSDMEKSKTAEIWLQK